MTDDLRKHADPASTADHAVDALSEALLHARLDGRDAMLYAPPAPFHVDIPSGVTRVHFAVDSRLIVRVDGQAMPIVLEPRDFVLVRQGARAQHCHRRFDGPCPRAGRVRPRHRRGGGAGLGHRRVPRAERARRPVDRCSSPVVHISSARPGNEWLGLSLRLLLDELGQRRPGACIMISRILDLVFIHALREWSASDKVEPGWLATALDQTPRAGLGGDPP
ncbi:cupin domain-containing protein [Microbacterium oxydans]|nr:cupin domain-containing protein [Microbacterium oxydans]